MQTILITGATGFLGSHISETLIDKGYRVIAIKRNSSNTWRCRSFENKIHWIDFDDLAKAEASIIESQPEILIHAAWGGVSALERNNWVEQEKNLSFLVSLLEIVRKTEINTIVALGSQAEYGHFEGAVDENYPCKPNNSYGTTKVCASMMLKSFAEQNNIKWYWIRIFSVFGPREEKNWLIPAAINNLIEQKEMKLTPCEQKYDYLFVSDLALGILAILKDNTNKSGLYNLSSGKSISLKEILSFIEAKLSPEKKLLKIGALPYRLNQVMHMQGRSDRFFQSFSYKPTYSIFDGLEETIKYYINQRNHA